jgi:putative N6-adenine-specific DNA methylase
VGERRFNCVATASFGLEAVVRSELERLGIEGARAEDMRVLFPASATDIARCNIGLRAADRVLIEAASFPAPDFDALFEGVRAVPWRDLLGSTPSVTVDARSVRSRLTAVPTVQSVTKKAIVAAVSGAKRMEERGPHFDVQVSLHKDQASVCLDTTGAGLHKRGYRHEAGEAPLRENLAAARVLLSRWDPSRPFADPLCGSGTIAIEAAMIAANIAPGAGRKFAAEQWPLIPAGAWSDAREAARAAVRPGEAAIDASDRDPFMRGMAERNARAAGVLERIRFRTLALEAFTSDADYGCIVCNPPYGERLGDEEAALALYRAMGDLHRRLRTWSFFALSSSEEFQRSFGERATRNRKLYNGNLRCWYYQYFGPLPGRSAPQADRAGS